MSELLIYALIVVVVVVLVGVFILARRGGISSTTTQAPEAATSGGALRDRLAKSRATLADSLSAMFGSSMLTDDDWAELEDALIAADVGPTLSTEIVEEVRRMKPDDGAAARVALEERLVGALSGAGRELRLDGSPAIIVVVGVNGTGKTTTIAKIAQRLVDDGRSVVLGAADTFRAAADSQLNVWGERVGVPVVSAAQGADPAAVAFDAFARATDLMADVVIIDTAGRLHNQANLMAELEKIVRVLQRDGRTIDEVLLVLDGTTGQNGLAQAKAFTEAVGVTGLVVTKLDGTSRGGIAFAVERTLGLPIKLIGVGEGMGDLLPFDPNAFVEALIER